jgi:Lon protease-like protein
VLFPGGLLPLRIFESRYVDMVRDCTRTERPFGVVLIRSGHEAGAPAVPESVGTLAGIIDFDRGPEGLLHLIAQGGRRFQIHSRETTPAGLQIAEVSLLAEETADVPRELLRRLGRVLTTKLEQLGLKLIPSDPRLDDAAWVSYRLAECLACSMSFRQALLEMNNPAARLAHLNMFVRTG